MEEQSFDAAEKEREIQNRILELRRQPDVEINAEEYKEKVLKDLAQYQADIAGSLYEPSYESERKKSVIEVKPMRKQPKERKNIALPPDPSLKKFNKYFETIEGAAFLTENPPTRETVEPLAALEEIDPRDVPGDIVKSYESMRETLSQRTRGTASRQSDQNPMVTLEPERQIKPSQSKYAPRTVILKPVDKPSCFAEIDRLQILKEQADKLAAYEYADQKTHKFGLTGEPRQAVPRVKAIMRANPAIEPNDKYIKIEANCDRRVRTCSMAQRQYARAPNVQNIRREGIHQIMNKAFLKKQSTEEMMKTQNTMASAAVNDPLKRNLLILPGAVRFGTVKVGGVFELPLTIKNEDCQLLRFSLRQPKSLVARVQYFPGPLAPGMDLRCRVELSSTQVGKIETQFEVMCKSEIYYIPIYANVVDEQTWNDLDSESYRVQGRSALKHNVRQIDVMQDVPPALMSSTSESQMPRIPSVRENFSVDPDKSLNEVLKSQEGSRPSNF